MQESLHNKQCVSLIAGMRTAVREALSIATQKRHRSALRHQVQRFEKIYILCRMIKWINILQLAKKTSLTIDVGGRRIIRKTVFYP